MKEVYKMDKQRIEKAVKEILYAIGENPEREGLLETPKRVANMYEEVFAGVKYTNEQIANMFNKTFEDGYCSNKDDIVVIKDITAFSYCEHHMALMYDLNISVAYIPDGKIIGLSKVARICELICKRLQVQERIGSDIAETIQIATGSNDVMVIIKGKHSCMTARGIKNTTSETVTTTCRGRFQSEKYQNKIFNMIKN